MQSYKEKRVHSRKTAGTSGATGSGKQATGGSGKAPAAGAPASETMNSYFAELPPEVMSAAFGAPAPMKRADDNSGTAATAKRSKK